MADRLVLIAGTSSGVGKTTLAARLAEALGARDDGVLVPEDVIFRLPALSDLAADFRARRWPGPETLLDGFARLLASLPTQGWVVHDGSWMPTAEDLPWAQTSWPALVDFTRRLCELALPHNPAILFLYDDPAAAMARMQARDGRARADAWVDYVRHLPALAEWRDAEPAVLLAAAERRVREVWSTAGCPLLEVSACGTPDEVLRRALDALGAGTPVG